jgi:hypothetical protein
MTVITQVCLFLKIRYWRLRLPPTPDDPQQTDGSHHHQQQDDLLGYHQAGAVGFRRHHQPQAAARTKQRDQEHEADDGKGGKGIAEVGRNMLVADVVHPEPASKRQRDQKKQPDEAGVVQVGLGPGGNLADQRAAGIEQRHRFTAEQCKRHAQRHQDLHRGDAEVA